MTYRRLSRRVRSATIVGAVLGADGGTVLAAGAWAGHDDAWVVVLEKKGEKAKGAGWVEAASVGNHDAGVAPWPHIS